MLQLSEILNPTELSTMNQAGLMQVRSDIVSGVNLYARTKKVAQLDAWNKITMQGPIVTSLGGQVLARGFNRVIPAGDKKFPESWRENWPDGFELTEMLDGWQGLLAESRTGTPVIVSEHGVNFQPARIASMLYYDRYRHVSWPAGYSPVFEILSLEHQRVVPPGANMLYLLALVNLRTGEEFPRKALEACANYNKFPLVRHFGNELEAVGAPRGFVATFRLEGEAPLRVKVECEEYQRIRNLMATTNPARIVEALKAGSDFYGQLHIDKELPIKFRVWMFKQRKRLNNEYVNRCEQLMELMNKCPFSRKPDAVDMRHVTQYFKSYAPKHVHILESAWRQEDNWRKLIWDSIWEDNLLEAAYLDMHV